MAGDMSLDAAARRLYAGAMTPPSAPAEGGRVQRSGRFAPAHLVFFVAAFGYAAVAVPWWTAAWFGAVAPACARCWLPAHHGHEMLLGFAAAVMAGFLFTRISRRVLAATFVAWLAARAAMALDAPAAALAVLLPLPLLALFWWGGRPFLKAAKTPHNAVPGLAVLALLSAEAAYVAARLGLWEGERAAVLLAFALVTLMLFVMGGRLLAAASAGALRLKGVTLPQRHLVQRPWEWAGVGGIAAMGLADAAGLPSAAALGAALAGAAALVRLAGWRPWRLWDEPGLWPLHLGYFWLGAGLLVRAAAQVGAPLPPQAGLHLVTVAALGCLAAGVAIRTVHQRARRPAPDGWTLPLVAAAFSLAGVLRAGVFWGPWALAAAAAVYALACLTVVAHIGRAAASEPPSG